MCAATTKPPSKSIGLYRTDEELIMLLVRMANGTRFPDDLIEGVNPYQYKPANLPENSWFYICLDQKKNSQHGFWKAKGEPSEILSNSPVTGLRTTLEFYEGWGPHAQRTNWVMQEYSITQKGLPSNNNLKGSKILCRVFLASVTNENENLQQNLDCAESAAGSFFHEKPSIGPETECNLRLSGSQARSRVDNIGGTSDGVKDLSEIDCIARGEYLELDDLVNPGSRSFSSDDSSCLTISSDECFDSLAPLKDLEDEIYKDGGGKSSNVSSTVAASAKPDGCFNPVALFKDLEDEINKDRQGKSANVSYTVAASAKPDECFDSLALLKDLEDEINKDRHGKSANVSYTAAASASAKPDECFDSSALLKDLEDEINKNRRGSHAGSGNESWTPNKAVEKRARDKKVAENGTETQNLKNGDKKTSTSDSEDEASSSSSHKSASQGEKKCSGRRLKKLKRKYLCFMPF